MTHAPADDFEHPGLPRAIAAPARALSNSAAQKLEHTSPSAIFPGSGVRRCRLPLEDYRTRSASGTCRAGSWTSCCGDVPLPGSLKRAAIRRRQRGFYVQRDGVRRGTWAHVESIYLKSLTQLEAIFRVRPYLLGELPTLADFGFFASMFRHFAQDPTASELMRARAPGVFEWQARLWNAKASRMRGALLSGIPADWSPILREIGDAYLPFLNANAEAWKAGRRRFDAEIQGAPYRRSLPAHARLAVPRLVPRAASRPLRGPARGAARRGARAARAARLLGAALPRRRDGAPGYDPEGQVPFRGRKVHYDNAR